MDTLLFRPEPIAPELLRQESFEGENHLETEVMERAQARSQEYAEARRADVLEFDKGCELESLNEMIGGTYPGRQVEMAFVLQAGEGAAYERKSILVGVYPERPTEGEAPGCVPFPVEALTAHGNDTRVVSSARYRPPHVSPQAQYHALEAIEAAVAEGQSQRRSTGIVVNREAGECYMVTVHYEPQIGEAGKPTGVVEVSSTFKKVPYKSFQLRAQEMGGAFSLVGDDPEAAASPEEAKIEDVDPDKSHHESSFTIRREEDGRLVKIKADGTPEEVVGMSAESLAEYMQDLEFLLEVQEGESGNEQTAGFRQPDGSLKVFKRMLIKNGDGSITETSIELEISEEEALLLGISIKDRDSGVQEELFQITEASLIENEQGRRVEVQFEMPGGTQEKRLYDADSLEKLLSHASAERQQELEIIGPEGAVVSHADALVWLRATGEEEPEEVVGDDEPAQILEAEAVTPQETALAQEADFNMEDKPAEVLSSSAIFRFSHPADRPSLPPVFRSFSTGGVEVGRSAGPGNLRVRTQVSGRVPASDSGRPTMSAIKKTPPSTDKGGGPEPRILSLSVSEREGGRPLPVPAFREAVKVAVKPIEAPRPTLKRIDRRVPQAAVHTRTVPSPPEGSLSEGPAKKEVAAIVSESKPPISPGFMALELKIPAKPGDISLAEELPVMRTVEMPSITYSTQETVSPATAVSRDHEESHSFETAVSEMSESREHEETAESLQEAVKETQEAVFYAPSVLQAQERPAAQAERVARVETRSSDQIFNVKSERQAARPTAAASVRTAPVSTAVSSVAQVAAATAHVQGNAAQAVNSVSSSQAAAEEANARQQVSRRAVRTARQEAEGEQVLQAGGDMEATVTLRNVPPSLQPLAARTVDRLTESLSQQLGRRIGAPRVTAERLRGGKLEITVSAGGVPLTAIIPD